VESKVLCPEHIVAQSKENTTDCVANIIPACPDCNKSKFDNNLKDWYSNQKFFSDIRLNKIRSHYKNYYYTQK
jgi:hypothetical protein